MSQKDFVYRNGRVAIGNTTNNTSPTAKFQVKADDGEALIYMWEYLKT